VAQLTEDENKADKAVEAGGNEISGNKRFFF
jgi:hypothetical protein